MEYGENVRRTLFGWQAGCPAFAERDGLQGEDKGKAPPGQSDRLEAEAAGRKTVEAASGSDGNGEGGAQQQRRRWERVDRNARGWVLDGKYFLGGL